MPRTARLDIPGGLYHVITRGIERRDLFCDETDRKEFLRRLELGLKETKAQCLAWTLMPNHIHLVIRTGPRPLCDLMRVVLTGYAIYFNRRHKRVGHLYQNRYKSILCQEDEYLKELVRYVHLNPLRAGLVKSISGLDAYPWSGHRALIGKAETAWQETRPVLEQFSADPKQAVRNYRAYVTEGAQGKRDDRFQGGGLRRSAGGWAGVRALRKDNERWAYDSQVLGDGDFVTGALKQAGLEETQRARLIRDGWTIGRLADHAGKIFGVSSENMLMRSRSSAISQARMVTALWAKRDLGARLSEIADYFDIALPSVSHAVKRGAFIEKEKNLKLNI